MRLRHLTKHSILALACAVAMAPALLLAVPASEPFGYTTGPLAGNSGGTGFTATAWTAVSGGTIDVTSPGLDQAGLGFPGTGNKITVTPTSGTTLSFRDLTSTFGADGTTTYFSMLGQKTNTGTRFFGTSLFSGATERALLGQGSGGTGNWLIGSGGTIADSGIPSSTFALLVAEITSQAGNDRVRLFVNPDLNMTRAQATASATLTTLDLATFNRIRVGAGFTSGANTTTTGHLDEIRVSTSSPFAAPSGLIAQEQFDYAAPGALSGNNGGTGFAAAWGSSVGTADVASPGLGYTDSLGNELVVAGNSAHLAGTSVSGVSFRELLGPVQPDVGQSLWLGALMQRDDTGNTRRGFNTALFNGSTEVFSFGQGNFLTGGLDDDAHPWQIFAPGTGGDTAAGTDTGDPAFLAVKLSYDGTDTLAELFINPVLDTEPTVADASLLLSGLQLTFDSIRPFAGGPSGSVPAASAFFDEIRIGANFVDVAPFTAVAVPEPSSIVMWSILSVGVAGLMLFRRTRRRGPA